MSTLDVGVVGAGRLGQAMARTALRAGRRVVMANSRGPRVGEAVAELGWDGRVVIDATNDFDSSDLNGSTSSQVLADMVPGARVVKAANTLGAAIDLGGLASGGAMQQLGGPLAGVNLIQLP